MTILKTNQQIPREKRREEAMRSEQEKNKHNLRGK
jgi:hypothetical protein